MSIRVRGSVDSSEVLALTTTGRGDRTDGLAGPLGNGVGLGAPIPAPA